MREKDIVHKICPIFLAAITIAKLCDTGRLEEEKTRYVDNVPYDLISIIKNKNGERKLVELPECHGRICAMWQWDDEKNREGHCGLTHGRNK